MQRFHSYQSRGRQHTEEEAQQINARAKEDFEILGRDTDENMTTEEKDSISGLSIFPKLTYKFNVVPTDALCRLGFNQADSAMLGSSLQGILSRKKVVKKNQNPNWGVEVIQR